MKKLLFILVFLFTFLVSNAEPYFEVYDSGDIIRIKCKSDAEFYITSIYKYDESDTLDFVMSDNLLIKKNKNFLNLKVENLELKDKQTILFQTKFIFNINIEYIYNGKDNLCELKIIKGKGSKEINESYNSSFKLKQFYLNNLKNSFYDSFTENWKGEYPKESIRYDDKDFRVIDLKLKNELRKSTTLLEKIPIINPKLNSKNELKYNGTAFAVFSDGYLVTNYHVIEGATELKIRGVDGDMKKSLKAKVISKDEKNDLAILKIDDPSFTSLGNVPINIVQKPIEVGSSIFVLGYPMIDAMGDEIKLTDGKISSRTGYQGDVSTYQISAPIQPGNSGGPLFDEEGNLIGITSSGITSANNVGYAIKTSYLMNMFDALQDYPNLTKTNTISKKKLPEKIKVLQKFIYIIENYQ